MLTKSIPVWLAQEFQRGHKITTEDISKRFGISRQAAHRHLAHLLKRGEIVRMGQTRGAAYIQNTPKLLKKVTPTWHFKKRLLAKGLSEDRVFDQLSERGALRRLSKPAKKIFQYAFTEMLNNAIEHSHTKIIGVSAESNEALTSFWIKDLGQGIFNHICRKKHLASSLEAIQELLKGKTTTAPKAHSGEGIFFTSKVADHFEIDSEGKLLIFDNRSEDIFLKDCRKRKGTNIFFQIRSASQKDISEIFRQYSGEALQFDRTKVAVKLFQERLEWVSRSQARRLLANLEKFKEITLDFKGVVTIGQGFADEIFRVFKHQHPHVAIHSLNANENVLFMIKRTI